jgi:hypothetical protein
MLTVFREVKTMRGIGIVKKRVGYGLLIGILFVASAVLLFILFSTQSAGINRTRFESLAIGMSKIQVQSILGGPPGDYTSGKVFVFAYESTRLPPEIVYDEWYGDEGRICVWFDLHGKASHMCFTEASIIPGGKAIMSQSAWPDWLRMLSVFD